jgi:hypothetical protein
MNACGLGIDICLFLGKNKVDMQFMVFFTESADVTESDGSREWISSPSKVRLARSNCPRHRYISLKKKTEQRATTAISTCEAIDILDTGNKAGRDLARYKFES